MMMMMMIPMKMTLPPPPPPPPPHPSLPMLVSLDTCELVECKALSTYSSIFFAAVQLLLLPLSCLSVDSVPITSHHAPFPQPLTRTPAIPQLPTCYVSVAFGPCPTETARPSHRSVGFTIIIDWVKFGQNHINSIIFPNHENHTQYLIIRCTQSNL